MGYNRTIGSVDSQNQQLWTDSLPDFIEHRLKQRGGADNHGTIAGGPKPRAEDDLAHLHCAAVYRQPSEWVVTQTRFRTCAGIVRRARTRSLQRCYRCDGALKSACRCAGRCLEPLHRV